MRPSNGFQRPSTNTMGGPMLMRLIVNLREGKSQTSWAKCDGNDRRNAGLRLGKHVQSQTTNVIYRDPKPSSCQRRKPGRESGPKCKRKMEPAPDLEYCKRSLRFYRNMRACFWRAFGATPQNLGTPDHQCWNNSTPFHTCSATLRS